MIAVMAGKRTAGIYNFFGLQFTELNKGIHGIPPAGHRAMFATSS